MINKYKEIYTRIGFNIKSIRKSKKMTQAQLADKTSKLDSSKISNIENASEDYMFSTILEIANGLGVDISEITQKTISDKNK